MGLILGRTPTETAATCSLPELLLILRRHGREEALREFSATWSRYEAGRAKWCKDTHKAMTRRLETLRESFEARPSRRISGASSLAATLSSLGVPSHG